MNILGLSETQFGWLFVPIVAGFILGAAANTRLAGRIPPERLVQHGYALMALGASLNIASNLCHFTRVPWAVLPLTIYTFGFSLVFPAITIQGLDLFPQRRGLASSLQGFSQIVTFAFISCVLAQVVYRSGTKHALGLAILMFLSWLAYRGYARFAPAPRQEDVLSSV